MLLLCLYELEIQDEQHQVWLVVSNHLKNISQIGNLPQIGVKIKHIWNHHLGVYWDKPKPSNLQDVRYFRGFPQRFLWSFFPVSFLWNLDVDILTKKTTSLFSPQNHVMMWSRPVQSWYSNNPYISFELYYFYTTYENYFQNFDIQTIPLRVLHRSQNNGRGSPVASTSGSADTLPVESPEVAGWNLVYWFTSWKNLALGLPNTLYRTSSEGVLDMFCWGPNTYKNKVFGSL